MCLRVVCLCVAVDIDILMRALWNDSGSHAPVALWDASAKDFTPPCVAALTELFHRFDTDLDSVLSRCVILLHFCVFMLLVFKIGLSSYPCVSGKS